MKNAEIMLDAIGDIDESLIPELYEKDKKSSGMVFYLIGGLCAAAILVTAIAIPTFRKNAEALSLYASINETKISDATSGTEKIDMNVLFGAMGAGEIMAEDISELDDNSPWSEDMDITKMPVLRNDAFIDDMGMLGGMELYLDEDQMIAIANNAAKALRLEITAINVVKAGECIEVSDPDEAEKIENKIESVDATCSDGSTITVYGDGSVRILFENEAIPSKYSFTYSSTTDSQAAEVLDYLIKEYGAFTGFIEPKGYSCVEKNIYGEDDRSYYIYDSAEDIREGILNHDLAYASFSPDEDGKLYCIWIKNAYCSSTYIGDYPIITVKEATDKLLNGQYYSAVFADEYFKDGLIPSGNIVRVQLKYRSVGEKYYIPYYEFYVAMDSETIKEDFDLPDGTRLYGTFYVPAIEDEYIDNLSMEPVIGQ